MTQLEQTKPAVLDIPAAAPNPLVRQVLRVAWLSICLGLALEVVLLTLAAFTDTAGRAQGGQRRTPRRRCRSGCGYFFQPSWR